MKDIEKELDTPSREPTADKSVVLKYISTLICLKRRGNVHVYWLKAYIQESPFNVIWTAGWCIHATGAHSTPDLWDQTVSRAFQIQGVDVQVVF